MKKYLQSINETNALIINGKLSDDEVNRIGTSDLKWAKSHEQGFRNGVRKGDIYQFDFGKNIPPEMSYEHRGLVLGVNRRLLYVLPIFTYKPNLYTDIYDKESNKKGDLYLLKRTDYAFLKRDSVLKLNDLRTVSVKRIAYKQLGGKLDIGDSVYKEIEQLVFEKYFSDMANTIRKQQLEIDRLNAIIKDLSKEHRMDPEDSDDFDGC